VITLALIGLVSGIAAGVSPCILPVLPVILLSSSTATGSTATGGAEGAEGAEGEVVATGRRDMTPYLVVAGLATSFSFFTLLGTLILKALHLPNDLIRNVGLVALVLLGISLIVPAVDRLLERPFSRLALGPGAGNRKGFALGIALGAVYIPCAGPVLAVISVAGATSKIGGSTVVLTLAFALGTSIPLLAFALAGRRITERIKAFRSRQRLFRSASGVVMIALALALTFNLTDAIQRLVPDPASAAVGKLNPTKRIQDEIGNERAVALSACADSPSEKLENCGKAPAIAGISSWFNTADDKPLTAADLQGKVVLVDFWAYSCINCQRAIPHVEAWSKQYAKDGLVVVGVHTPEYAFEHERGNVMDGAQRLGITYPVALDNDYGTWDSFGNSSWPAEYLIDANGVVRHVSIGEGDYGGTEKLIRQLLTDANPATKLSGTTAVPDTTPTGYQSQETYLGSQRGQFYVGKPGLTNGTHDFTFPDKIGQNSFTLGGSWKVGDESLVAGNDAKLAQAFTADKVYLDIGGEGTITVHVDGRTKTFDVHGAPNIYTVVDVKSTATGVVVIDVPPGLEAYSFTFG
jgi:cytochrome c biogenesis protein CcdA/thiol-disulfide isomerase/thioredoxin